MKRRNCDRPTNVLLPALLATALLSTSLCHAPTASAQDRAAQSVAAIGGVLDGLHDAASKADFDRYFSHYTSDGVFLGTDASERWTIPEFKEYARPAFDAGRGWTYVMKERFINVAPGGQTAWFDEQLENANLGLCRGSGVLVKMGDTWRVAQYNLTILIPNELAREVAGMIRKLDQ